MRSMFASDVAIAALAALTQKPAGLALADLSRAVGSPLSAVQKAVRLLSDAGLVVTDAEARPRYSIPEKAAPAAAALVEAALGMGQARALEAAVRANPAVEFAARDGAGLLVVTRFDSDVADEATLARVVASAGVPLEAHRHDDVRDEIDVEPGLRERAQAATLVTGSLERSFPDPGTRGSLRAPFLGRLHPSLRRASASAVARVARDFGLDEVRVFGSAVHEDFRPDSDVDVLVRRRPGVRRTLDGEMRLRRALEDVFGRDVDVVDAKHVIPFVAERAESEGVTLYG